LRETLLAAMGRVETGRLLDTRHLDLDGFTEEAVENPLVQVRG
jgi:hypothetical protein